MGVTIHFSGTLRDEAALAGIESDARHFAAERSWPVQTIDYGINASGDYTGVSIYPPENCEPIHLVFDEHLQVNEHVKTQFAGPETHIHIIELLRQLGTWFTDLFVEDEGEYWATKDAERLRMHMAVVSSRLEELARESEGLEIGVRLPSGRIVDLGRLHNA